MLENDLDELFRKTSCFKFKSKYLRLRLFALKIICVNSARGGSSLFSSCLFSDNARQTVLSLFLFPLEAKKRQLLEQRRYSFLGWVNTRFSKLREFVQWSVLFKESAIIVAHTSWIMHLSRRAYSRKRACKKRCRRRMQTVCGTLFLLLYSFRHRIFASGSIFDLRWSDIRLHAER